MAYKQKPWSGWSPAKQKEGEGDIIQDDEILQPEDINLPDISKEVLDIYDKLDWTDKDQIPIEEFQKAYFEQQRREKEWEIRQQNIDRSA